MKLKLTATIFILFLMTGKGFTFEMYGYNWIVKNPPIKSGPGPNYFSSDSIIIDESLQQISLSLTQKQNRWYSGEIFSDTLFSFGEFTLVFSIPAKLDSQLVFGFFLYNDQFPPFFEEIDFEIAEWGDIINNNSQFSIQPYSTDGNSTTFDLEEIFIENKIVIDWQKEKVSFNLYDKSGNIRSSWIYKGNDIPREGSSRVHINLWLFQGQSPVGNGSLDVLIHNFQYREIQ